MRRRVLRKIPDMLESFIGKAADLLNDRNHGVLLSGGAPCMLAMKLDVGVLTSLKCCLKYTANGAKFLAVWFNFEWEI